MHPDCALQTDRSIVSADLPPELTGPCSRVPLRAVRGPMLSLRRERYARSQAPTRRSRLRSVPVGVRGGLRLALDTVAIVGLRRRGALVEHEDTNAHPVCLRPQLETLRHLATLGSY